MVFLKFQDPICFHLSKLTGHTYTRLEFSIPARGLIGYRGEFMTDTKGNGILNTVFDDYGPYKGDIQYRKNGFPDRI